MMRVVKELESVDTGTVRFPRRRIVIVQRGDGFFSYGEEYHYVAASDGKIIAEGWQLLPAIGIYESLEVAENEGRIDFHARYGIDY